MLIDSSEIKSDAIYPASIFRQLITLWQIPLTQDCAQLQLPDRCRRFQFLLMILEPATPVSFGCGYLFPK